MYVINNRFPDFKNDSHHIHLLNKILPWLYSGDIKVLKKLNLKVNQKLFYEYIYYNVGCQKPNSGSNKADRSGGQGLPRFPKQKSFFKEIFPLSL